MTEIPVIEFARPMLGFPEHRRFALVQLDDDGVLCALSSVDDPELRFLVASPVPFFPEYAPVVDHEVVTELALTGAEDAMVLLVLTAGATLDETTANLLAPVVVNVATRRAAQVVLDDSTLPVAAPLMP